MYLAVFKLAVSNNFLNWFPRMKNHLQQLRNTATFCHSRRESIADNYVTQRHRAHIRFPTGMTKFVSDPFNERRKCCIPLPANYDQEEIPEYTILNLSPLLGIVIPNLDLLDALVCLTLTTYLSRL